METVVYKRVGPLEIALDVQPGRPGAPVVVWIHGGALIMGQRGHEHPYLLGELARRGYGQVSIDYRLAPETKLPGILEDVLDALAWVRGHGAERFGWDAARLGVVGHSAGGYLTLMAGVHARPRPRALVSFYGYGDVAGDWYARPDPFYCAMPMVDRDETYAGVGRGETAGTSGDEGRSRFYLYCRQQGLWPREVVGLDPDTQDAAFGPYCPIRNVGGDFPPTLLLHGTADTDVPYAQSVEMAAALARAGVPHELVTIPGGPHGFDRRGADGRNAEDVPATAAAFARVLSFFDEHLARPSAE